jgi:hypothetical protein
MATNLPYLNGGMSNWRMHLFHILPGSLRSLVRATCWGDEGESHLS